MLAKDLPAPALWSPNADPSKSKQSQASQPSLASTNCSDRADEAVAKRFFEFSVTDNALNSYDAIAIPFSQYGSAYQYTIACAMDSG